MGRQRHHAGVARTCHRSDQLLRRAHPHRPGALPPHRRGPGPRHARAAAAGPVRAHARRAARDRSRARLARALRPSRHAVARRRARQPAAVMAAGTSDLLPSTLLLGRPSFGGTNRRRSRPATATSLVRAIEVKHWGARIRATPIAATPASSSSAKAGSCSSAATRPPRRSFADHRRFGPFDAAVMPIGAYDPWIRNHCTPEQAVSDGRCRRRAALRAGAPSVVSV